MIGQKVDTNFIIESTMKHTTIQPCPLPETIFERHDNWLLRTKTTIGNVDIETNNNNFNCFQ
jgi:hypothetical protein